jgi:hypothetical protein
MFALPGFLLVDAIGDSIGRTLLLLGTWCFTIGGLGLSYWAAAMYVPLARRALNDGRAARATEVVR